MIFFILMLYISTMDVKDEIFVQNYNIVHTIMKKAFHC